MEDKYHIQTGLPFGGFTKKFEDIDWNKIQQIADQMKAEQEQSVKQSNKR